MNDSDPGTCQRPLLAFPGQRAAGAANACHSGCAQQKCRSLCGTTVCQCRPLQGLGALAALSRCHHDPRRVSPGRSARRARAAGPVPRRASESRLVWAPRDSESESRGPGPRPRRLGHRDSANPASAAGAASDSETGKLRPLKLSDSRWSDHPACHWHGEPPSESP